MRLAFLLYRYHPRGARQRDLRCFLRELQARGHYCRVYCHAWQGEMLDGVDLRRVSAAGLFSRRREQRFVDAVFNDLRKDPVDGVIGFDKIPGLDIYVAVDDCCLDGTPGRRRAGHAVAWERSVFAPRSETHVFLTVAAMRDSYRQRFNTPEGRLHLLPPGVTPDRRAPQDAPARRKASRTTLGLEPQEFALLFAGSNFAVGGLDRAITALAHMREEQPSVASRLLVLGEDSPRRYRRLAKRLDIGDRVVFLGGRDDVLDLMLGADLLVHPAIEEATGIVLLEALAAGLPVVVTDVCGYAQHVASARAGILLPSPFSQEQLDRAVMRYLDGIFRSDCRESALLYARLTDLYSLHRAGADLIEQLIGEKRTRVGV